MLKKKVKTSLSIIAIIIITSIITSTAKQLPLAGKVITIDPGHGGRDPGTYYKGILEKDINLQISLALEEELLEKGATVYLIRRSDIDLSSIYDPKKKRGDLYRRLLMIKKNQSDMYLSIHINWYQNTYYKGAEVLYNQINSQNKKLATAIMQEFKSNLNSKRQIHTTDLYMYKNTTILGVLIECGYLSNASERNLLTTDEYQKKLAKSITSGIINYFEDE